MYYVLSLVVTLHCFHYFILNLLSLYPLFQVRKDEACLKKLQDLDIVFPTNAIQGESPTHMAVCIVTLLLLESTIYCHTLYVMGERFPIKG